MSESEQEKIQATVKAQQALAAAGKMHDGEVTIDVPMIKRLLEAQFPQYADLPIRRVASSGTDNALYRLGNDIVARLPRMSWVVGNVEKEYNLLPKLAPHLPVEISLPLGLGEPGEGYPFKWSIYSWLHGGNSNFDCLDNPHQLTEDIIEFITVLRRLDTTDGPPAGRSLTRMDEPVRSAINELRLLGLTDADAVTEVWEDALKLPAWDGPLMWMHGDLAPGNLILEGGRLKGVIDFSGAGVGEPISDLGVAWNLLPASVREDFRSALNVDETTWIRGRARSLGQALVQLPYYHITNPELSAQSRHVISEVLTDYRRTK